MSDEIVYDEFREPIPVTISDYVEVEVDEAFPPMGQTNNELNHALLNNRDIPNQHPIAAIEGLRDELDNIESLKTEYSDKMGFANYYPWEDGGDSEHSREGYFVTVSDRERRIKICDGQSEVFGVTISQAGFIGNQDGIPNDDEHSKYGVIKNPACGSEYGLVAHSGIVNVHCNLDVTKNSYVISDDNGYAKVVSEADGGYGFKVIAIDWKDGSKYAVISLDASINQLHALGKEALEIRTRMTGLEKNVTTAVNVANQALSKVNDIGVVNQGISDKVDEIANAVDDNNQQIADVNNKANQAVQQAQQAQQTAQEISNQVVENAKVEMQQLKEDVSKAQEIANKAQSTADSAASLVQSTKEEIQTNVTKTMDEQLNNINNQLDSSQKEFNKTIEDKLAKNDKEYQGKFLTIENNIGENNNKITNLTTSLNKSYQKIKSWEGNTYTSLDGISGQKLNEDVVYYDGTNYYYIKDKVWQSTTDISDTGLIGSIAGIKQKVDENGASINSLTNWQGETSKSIASISQKADANESQINNLVTWQGEAETNIASIQQKADANGASIDSLVANISMYAVGDTSPTWGLSYDEARTLMPVGMIFCNLNTGTPYIEQYFKLPSSSYEIVTDLSKATNKSLYYCIKQSGGYYKAYDYDDENQQWVELTEDNNALFYQASFNKERVYVWIKDGDNYSWVEQSKILNVEENSIPSNTAYDYWYYPLEATNTDNVIPDTYIKGTLYKSVDGVWKAVATYGEYNYIRKSMSLIHQTADEISLSVKSNADNIAAIKLNSDDNESMINLLCSFTGDNYEKVDSFSGIEENNRDKTKVYYSKADRKFYYFKDPEWKSTTNSYEAGITDAIANIRMLANEQESVTQLINTYVGKRIVDAVMCDSEPTSMETGIKYCYQTKYYSNVVDVKEDPGINNRKIGEIYYNKNEKVFYFYNGSFWTTTARNLDKLGCDQDKIYCVKLEDQTIYYYYSNSKWLSTTDSSVAGVSSETIYICQYTDGTSTHTYPEESDLESISNVVLNAVKKIETYTSIPTWTNEQEDSTETSIIYYVQDQDKYYHYDDSKLAWLPMQIRFYFIYDVTNKKWELQDSNSISFMQAISLIQSKADSNGARLDILLSGDKNNTSSLAAIIAKATGDVATIDQVTQWIDKSIGLVYVEKDPGKDNRSIDKIYYETNDSGKVTWIHFYNSYNSWGSLTPEQFLNSSWCKTDKIYHATKQNGTISYYYYDGSSWQETTNPSEAGVFSNLANLKVQSDENGSKIEGLTTKTTELGEDISKLTLQADSFQTLVANIDKYSVGEYSQAVGLSLEEANNILYSGMIFVPLKDVNEAYEFPLEDFPGDDKEIGNILADLFSNRPIDKYFINYKKNVQYHYYYEDENSTIEMYFFYDGTKWASSSEPAKMTQSFNANHIYEWGYNEVYGCNTWNEKTTEAQSTSNDTVPSTTKVGELWYYYGTSNITDSVTGLTYKPKTLCKCVENSVDFTKMYWTPVASADENSIARSLSQIRQTSNNIALEVSDAKKQVASMQLTVDNIGVHSALVVDNGVVKAYMYGDAVDDTSSWTIGASHINLDGEITVTNTFNGSTNGTFSIYQYDELKDVSNNYWLKADYGNTTPFSVDMSGALTATKGKIGGWTINDTSISGSWNNEIVDLTSEEINKIDSGVIISSVLKDKDKTKQYHYQKTETHYYYYYDFTNQNWITKSTPQTVKKQEFYIASPTDSYDMWIKANLNDDTKFSVSRDGILTATNADIAGKITATDGTVGGWNIDSDKIYSSWYVDKGLPTQKQQYAMIHKGKDYHESDSGTPIIAAGFSYLDGLDYYDSANFIVYPNGDLKLGGSGEDGYLFIRGNSLQGYQKELSKSLLEIVEKEPNPNDANYDSKVYCYPIEVLDTNKNKVSTIAYNYPTHDNYRSIVVKLDKWNPNFDHNIISNINYYVEDSNNQAVTYYKYDNTIKDWVSTTDPLKIGILTDKVAYHINNDQSKTYYYFKGDKCQTTDDPYVAKAFSDKLYGFIYFSSDGIKIMSSPESEFPVPIATFNNNGTILTGNTLRNIYAGLTHERWFWNSDHTICDLAAQIKFGCGMVDDKPSISAECWEYINFENMTTKRRARMDVYEGDGYSNVCLKLSRNNEAAKPLVFDGNKLYYDGSFYLRGIEVTSVEDIKTNISTTNSLLSLFKPENSQIYSYNLKKTPTTESSTTSSSDGDLSFDSSETINLEEAEETTSYGFVIGEGYTVPTEVLAPDGKAINLYSMASINWKATQELYAALLDAQNRITELENQLNNAT